MFMFSDNGKVLVHINVSHVKPLSKDYTTELNKCLKETNCRHA